MSKPPRKKIGLELSDRDKQVIQKTAEPTPLAPPKNQPTTAKTKSSKSTGSKAAHSLTANELRCYIPRQGEFAAELAAQLDQLDPKARRFVSPSSVLTEFMQKYDKELTEMFRSSDILT